MDKQITPSLIKWYQANKRKLPWREIKSPYAVVVSEMMLQQTQVNTVIDYFNRFLERFPSFESLAEADEQEVLTLWQGLGYYSRARNLHKIAKIVVDVYRGELPKSYDELKKLPGIGEYMAGAVTSIGFDIPMPAVDGNVLRVVSRLDGIFDDIAVQKTRRVVFDYVKEILPITHAGDFTQALMELGAVICKPKNPICSACPVRTFCFAYANDKIDMLPIKKPKEKAKTILLDVYIIRTATDILMQKRPDKGLLAGMWGLPTGEYEDSHIADLMKKLGIEKNQRVSVGETVHVFTHQRWEMRAFLIQMDNRREVEHPYAWISERKIDELPIPTAYKKIFSLYMDGNNGEQE